MPILSSLQSRLNTKVHANRIQVAQAEAICTACQCARHLFEHLLCRTSRVLHGDLDRSPLSNQAGIFARTSSRVKLAFPRRSNPWYGSTQLSCRSPREKHDQH